MPKSLFEHTSFQLDATLNMTKVELEIISDADMYLFFGKGMVECLTFLKDIPKPTISI